MLIPYQNPDFDIGTFLILSPLQLDIGTTIIGYKSLLQLCHGGILP